MSLFTWRGWMKRQAKSILGHKAANPGLKRRRTPYRPLLETLEDRTLLDGNPGFEQFLLTPVPEDVPLAMHIHTHLSIVIDGEARVIPEGIGITADGDLPIHTHDATGRLHIESPEVQEFHLRDVFTVWGQTFTSQEILGHQADASHFISMTVNGQASTALGAQVLRDLDNIVIQYGALQLSNATAAVWTDRLDYAPGTTAFIAGTGFAAGETVDLQVLHSDGRPNTDESHTPWTVTADARGVIRTSWVVDPVDAIDSTLQVSAIGATSHQLAQATFTDSGSILHGGRKDQIDCPDFVGHDIGWTWVDPSSDATRIREVTGKVVPFSLDTGKVESSGDELEQSDLDGNRSSFLTHTDGPPYHNSHDFNTHVIVDEPLHDALLSPTNDLDDDTKDETVNLGDLHPTMMEVEWESGILPTEKTGDGTAGFNNTPIFPKWAWPSPGDRVWFMGNHIYDCGHPIELTDDNEYYKSEIHPAIAVASMRDEVMLLPGTGPTPVRVTATDLYIHGDGGFATSVLAEHSIFGGSEDHTTSIARDYDFDIHLPPRPSPTAMLAHPVLIGPGNTWDTPESAPVFMEDFDNKAGPMLHVHIHLAGSGIPDLGVYARQIIAGWVEPEEGIHHIQITLNQMLLHNDMELQGFDGELSFFFLNVPQAPIEWQRMSDFQIPTTEVFHLPASLVCGGQPGTIIVFPPDKITTHTNTMDDYDDDTSRTLDLCGNGILNFSGPTFDLFVKDPKPGEVNPPPPIQILARGYDQDCYDDVFGEHTVLGFAHTEACSIVPGTNGDNDLYNMWTAQLDAPSYGVGTLHKANIDNQYELTFTVTELAPPPQPRHVDLPAGGGTYELLIDGNDLVLRRQGGPELFRKPKDSVTKFTVNGSADNDKLIIIHSGGNPVPPLGVFFNGGDQTGVPGDTLELTAGSFNTITHRFLNDHDGVIFLDPDGPGGTAPSVVTYTGLEPIFDHLGASNRVFDFTGAAETITLSDGAGAGVSRIDSTLGESVDFTNPSSTLTVNASAGSGPDTVTIQALDAAFNANVTVNASSGGDHITLTATTGTTNTWTINGGSGADMIDVSGWTRSLALDGKGDGDSYFVTFTGSGSATVQINDTGGSGTDAVTVTGTASADTLEVTTTQVTRASETVASPRWKA
jgi:hypothetical protein